MKKTMCQFNYIAPATVGFSVLFFLELNEEYPPFLLLLTLRSWSSPYSLQNFVLILSESLCGGERERKEGERRKAGTLSLLKWSLLNKN